MCVVSWPGRRQPDGRRAARRRRLVFGPPVPEATGPGVAHAGRLGFRWEAILGLSLVPVIKWSGRRWGLPRTRLSVDALDPAAVASGHRRPHGAATVSATSVREVGRRTRRRSMQVQDRRLKSRAPPGGRIPAASVPTESPQVRAPSVDPHKNPTDETALSGTRRHRCYHVVVSHSPPTYAFLQVNGVTAESDRRCTLVTDPLKSGRSSWIMADAHGDQW